MRLSQSTVAVSVEREDGKLEILPLLMSIMTSRCSAHEVLERTKARIFYTLHILCPSRSLMHFSLHSQCHIQYFATLYEEKVREKKSSWVCDISSQFCK